VSVANQRAAHSLHCLFVCRAIYSITAGLDCRSNVIELDYFGCVLFQNLTNLNRSRFVRRDWSSPVKKNAQIFLVIVGVVILFSSAQSTADHALF